MEVFNVAMGEYYSDVFKLGSIPDIKNIEKCDNE